MLDRLFGLIVTEHSHFVNDDKCLQGREGSHNKGIRPTDAETPLSHYGSEVFFVIVPLPAAGDGSVGAVMCLLF